MTKCKCKCLPLNKIRPDDKTFVVGTDGVLSNVAPVTCGVPQGSILGLSVLTLCIAPLTDIQEAWDFLSLLCR